MRPPRYRVRRGNPPPDHQRTQHRRKDGSPQDGGAPLDDEPVGDSGTPAAPESSIPWFDHWGVDIGDEQSLDEALSTFSGHLRAIADLCRAAGPRSLILLDELGSGTDPDEGAALSMAVVDHLIERGSTVLVTTHQTVLKHYGYTRESARNASMAFDEETHSPTYRVITGRPGSSHALDTARAQGLPEEILMRASEYLADRGSSVAEIIARLGDLEDELRTQRKALAEDADRIKRREGEIREREESLLERETVLRREGLVELDRLVREARSRVEGEVRRLRERGVRSRPRRFAAPRRRSAG
jgi:DNA mismatch repair protein MutS2